VAKAWRYGGCSTCTANEALTFLLPMRADLVSILFNRRFLRYVARMV
jgi:hypothetical protein